MSLSTNPSAARKLAQALASGRRQVGSNGDGNASSANQEGLSPSPASQDSSTGKNFATGTNLSGYSTPDQGPFRCDHCKFYDANGSACSGPNVMKDPQVQKLGDGRAMVEPSACCSKDYTPSSSTTPGFTSIARPGTIGGSNPGSQPPGFNSNGPLQAPRTTLRSPGSVG